MTPPSHIAGERMDRRPVPVECRSGSHARGRDVSVVARSTPVLSPNALTLKCLVNQLQLAYARNAMGTRFFKPASTEAPKPWEGRQPARRCRWISPRRCASSDYRQLAGALHSHWCAPWCPVFVLLTVGCAGAARRAERPLRRLQIGAATGLLASSSNPGVHPCDGAESFPDASMRWSWLGWVRWVCSPPMLVVPSHSTRRDAHPRGWLGSREGRALELADGIELLRVGDLSHHFKRNLFFVQLLMKQDASWHSLLRPRTVTLRMTQEVSDIVRKTIRGPAKWQARRSRPSSALTASGVTIAGEAPRSYAAAKAIWSQSRETKEYQSYAAEFSQFNNHFHLDERDGCYALAPGQVNLMLVVSRPQGSEFAVIERALAGC